ncbi:MAG TPA: beta-ketoacyl synthase N-terminal-like domain-containing protein, partial [Chthoniobacteraceae bacterium]|nr:beta-ketoacyl synthase N-terminal-like domain-containing protein [Chthoniobacteraceae bacterium]
MRAALTGLGWVTPLGADLAKVYDSLMAGSVAETRPIQNPETGAVHLARTVPPKLVESLARNPRLRRSSPISYFAVAAAIAALADAGCNPLTPDQAARTAVVFGVSNGGVIYTRRFYEQILKQGANSASPLLFPETVYNAPASHLAAALGIDGASYTLVGDNAVGMSALNLGAQLLALGECDRVVVVGCEEVDWIVCEAFHDWLLAPTPMSEGGSAIVLERDGPISIQTCAGVSFSSRRGAVQALRRAVEGRDAALIVSGSNGSFIDRTEREVFSPQARWLFPKHQLGEAPGASALWQTVLAALTVRARDARDALVPVVGFNQQASCVLIS